MHNLFSITDKTFGRSTSWICEVGRSGRLRNKEEGGGPGHGQVPPLLPTRNGPGGQTATALLPRAVGRFSLRPVHRFVTSDRPAYYPTAGNLMSLLSSGGIYFLAPELGPSCPSSEANSPHRGGAGPDSGEHKASSSSSPDGQPPPRGST